MDTFEARQLLTVSPFLQGTVFADGNGNGALDTTEAPLPNATVDLYLGNSATRLATTTTAADGGYKFDGGNVAGGLTVGATYRLVESAAGYSNTGAQALSTLNPAAVLSTSTIQVTVVDPNSITASFTGPESYGNPPYNGIYYSLNGTSGTDNPTQLFFSLSGAQALNASSIESLCVGVGDHLSFNSPFGTVVDSQGAMPNGGQIAYLFNHYATSSVNTPATPFPATVQGLSAKNIASGLQVAVWQLEYGSAYVLTGAQAGYTSAQDYSDIQAAAAAFVADSTGKSEKMIILDASKTGQIPTPTATPGGQSILAAMSYNFGNKAVPLGSLSGFVYADANNNGSKDAAEKGIGNVPVTLTGVANGKPVTVASTTTNPDGSYSFANLAPGTYAVVEGATPGYLPDSTNTGSIVGVTVTQGANNPNNNFGEILPGSIAGVVYADKTGDGLSGDDAALPGVTVQLVDATGKVIAAQKAGADGSYSFTNLAPGTYTVQEVVPTGYVQTGPSSLTYTVPLAAGQAVTNENFDNYQVNCGCCPIGGISYTDVGPCGVSTFSSLGGNTNQGDQVTVNFTVGGNAPVTVTLVSYTATSNFDLTKQSIFSVATQTLAPGPHSLTVTIPNSYYQVDFVCGGAIGQFNPAANVTYHGEGRFIDADHGGSEAAPAAFASLAGSVFVDNNYDGKFGANDSGLGGVTVRLTGKDTNGQAVSLTRITGKDGSYNFAGLQAGTYKVNEVTPAGYFTTRDSVGTVNGAAVGSLASPTADAITAITLAGGNSGVNYNFGEQAVGSALGCNQTASTGFWNSCSGQNLIRSLNGSSAATGLGTWLASTLPNSLSSLAGKTNAQVAAYFQSAYSQCRSSPLTEGLATALAVYATDSGLAGGNYAACYGLKVTAAGAGAATFDVGNTFSCYGGPTGRVTLLQLLRYADANAGSCDYWFGYRVACVFDQINGCGSC